MSLAWLITSIAKVYLIKIVNHKLSYSLQSLFILRRFVGDLVKAETYKPTWLTLLIYFL